MASQNKTPSTLVHSLQITHLETFQLNKNGYSQFARDIDSLLVCGERQQQEGMAGWV
jgi:hypothetical protein